MDGRINRFVRTDVGTEPTLIDGNNDLFPVHEFIHSYQDGPSPNNTTGLAGFLQGVTADSKTGVIVNPFVNFKIWFDNVRNHSGDGRVKELLSEPWKSDFHHLIKNVEIPNISSVGQDLLTPISRVQLSTMIPMTASGDNDLIIHFLTAKNGAWQYNLFFDWMKRCLYKNTKLGPKNLNFPRADLTIEFPSYNEPDSEVVFKYYNVRPMAIEILKPTNEPNTNFYRYVKFKFDYFWVNPLKGN